MLSRSSSSSSNSPIHSLVSSESAVSRRTGVPSSLSWLSLSPVPSVITLPLSGLLRERSLFEPCLFPVCS
eukprot:g39778.t1